MPETDLVQSPVLLRPSTPTSQISNPLLNEHLQDTPRNSSDKRRRTEGTDSQHKTPSPSRPASRAESLHDIPRTHMPDPTAIVAARFKAGGGIPGVSAQRWAEECVGYGSASSGEELKDLIKGLENSLMLRITNLERQVRNQPNTQQKQARAPTADSPGTNTPSYASATAKNSPKTTPTTQATAPTPPKTNQRAPNVKFVVRFQGRAPPETHRQTPLILSTTLNFTLARSASARDAKLSVLGAEWNRPHNIILVFPAPLMSMPTPTSSFPLSTTDSRTSSSLTTPSGPSSSYHTSPSTAPAPKAAPGSRAYSESCSGATQSSRTSSLPKNPTSLPTQRRASRRKRLSSSLSRTRTAPADGTS
ncbi:hypothetical protein HGRIS_001259 [Hohenbuehelia grisea]|uniref:Uncharacterized protein n=1 Tax=Hohenbuehelia grisea TaxID=104357 RepID=A0ABR3JQ26_9AGAR